MKRKTTVGIILVLISLYCSSAFSYDDRDSHPRITKVAIEKSHLNTYLIQNLGFKDGIETKITLTTERTIRDWLAKGSTDEDSPMCRAANHFHDPLAVNWSSAAMTDQPWFIDAWCSDWKPLYSNVTWATGYLSPAPAGQKVSFSNYSSNSPLNWDRARDYYYKALTLTTKEDREIYFEWTFQVVGQVMHLLQDVSVPAHVRNDFTSHLIFNKINSINPGKWFIQPFEHYVKTHPDLVAATQPVSPSFTNPRLTDFWDTNIYNGSSPAIRNDIGLAEYTNANFLSNYTIFKNYPHPAKENTTAKLVEQYAKDGKLDKVWYVMGYTSERLAAYSYFWKNGLPPTTLWLYHLDDYVHADYASQLIPRAIGYSAGLLNYFFRGDLEATSTLSGLKVKNINSETISSYTDSSGATIGNIGIYYDDGNNFRRLLASYDLTTPLASGDEVVIPYTPPSDNAVYGKYTIVFRGKLGNEEGAVIGKVINLKHIYYISARSGIEKIYKMAADGSSPTLVYDNQDSNVYVRKPMPSPDGSLLSFVAFNGLSDYIGATYLLSLADGTISALTTGEGFGWSPDGRKIVLQRETGQCLPNYADYEIFIRDLTTGIETQITERYCIPSIHPVWSSGNTIAYAKWQDNAERSGNCLNFSVIYLMDTSGNPIKPLTCGSDGYEDYAPSWSPDGSEIVFIRNVSPQNYYQLYKVNINTGTITKLTDSDGTNFDESIPAWSPDGAAIAIGSSRDGDYDIWLVNHNGGGYNINLTNSNTEYDIQPAFER